MFLLFRCDCSKEFTGPRCEVNINECESSPCQNQGTCLDERGAFRCVCMPGKIKSFSLFLGRKVGDKATIILNY